MYIICGIITIPLGIVGYFVLPGTPDRPNRFVLTKRDTGIAKSRLERHGHGTSTDIRWSKLFIKIIRNWQVWAFLLLDALFWNAGSNVNAGGYLLWLQSLQRYSTSRLNALAAISPGLGIAYTILVCFASDLWIGPVWAITVSQLWNITGIIILLIWNVPESAKWFAFQTVYGSIAMSSALYGWVNTELRYSPVERATTLIVINIFAQSTTAWTPLLTFKTVEAPRWTKGYSFMLACSIGLILWSHGIRYITKQKE